MSVNFIHSGSKTFVEKMPDGIRTDTLKAALYTIESSREEGLFLVEIGKNYTLPEKTYGDYPKAAVRVIRTHYSKTGNTGILLTGLKGTGKSLFVKVISNAMIELGVPVIQINKPYHGDDIFNFVENIGNCVLVFDEFGKHYSVYQNGNAPTQDGLLSLLDGLTNAKRLHLFTENSVDRISEFLINRPGRVHYHFRYNRLPTEVIEEYCKDLGVPDEVISEMLELSTRLRVLSFDIIKCLVNEWKLYGGKLEDHIGILNISLCNDPTKQDIEVVSIIRKDGTIVPTEGVTVTSRHGRIMIDKGREFNEQVHLSEATKITGNVYYFVLQDATMISLRIREGYSEND